MGYREVRQDSFGDEVEVVAGSACMISASNWHYHASFVVVAYTSVAIWAVGFLLTGRLLGLALGTAVERGQSSVPGVQRVARVISEGNASGSHAGTDRAAAEVIPCGTPEGRGDELIPSKPSPAGLGGDT